MGKACAVFIITNRRLHSKERGLNIFGDRCNKKGVKELRAVEVTRLGGEWSVNVVPDFSSRDELLSLDVTEEDLHRLGFDAQDQIPGSAMVVQRTLRRLQALPESRRSLLVYVHGYNNNVESVVRRATEIEEEFGVVCLPFSWPANGGGDYVLEKAHGLASYRSDKQYAEISQSAFDRFMLRLDYYLDAYYVEERNGVEARVLKQHKLHPKNDEARVFALARALKEICPITVNIMFHSMGNYLYQHTLQSGSFRSNQTLIFDNVILAAADTNSENHKEWVDKIPFRRNLYITINEDDIALSASRKKFGDRQKARLGHFRHGLNSVNAKYIDFTGASDMDNAHAYFCGSPLQNAKVRSFFNTAFAGGRGEATAKLKYNPATNMYCA